MGIVIFIIIFLICLYAYPVPTIIITALLILFLIVNEINVSKKRKEAYRLKLESAARAKEVYYKSKSEIYIPQKASTVTYKEGYAELLNTENYIWIENNDICFFPKNPPDRDTSDILKKIVLYKIPLNKIEYYATMGEVFRENKITGGGGGGSSIEGTVTGGLIAGGAGAVIGSRKKTDQIKSELVTHDTRETLLNFFDDKNEKHSMFFEYKDYNIFKDLIPEKSFEIVSMIETSNILNMSINKNSTENITDQIRKLAQLRDEGIITEEEFVDKKEKLLAKI